MTFKKLALAAAIAAAPVASMAMQPMQDEALSGVTGRDGISIGINTSGLSMDAYIHDKDGLGTGPFDSGAIVITGMNIDTGGNDIQIDIDADGNAAGTDAGALLNVKVTLPNTIAIDTGSISVADSDRGYTTPGDATTTATGDWGISGQTDTILKNTHIELGTTTLNIQLGHEEQGSMIALNTTITNGVTLTDGGILDASNSYAGTGGGDIGILFDSMSVTNSGASTDLTVDADVDVEANGLVVTLNQLGDASNGIDVQIVNQRLGYYDSANAADTDNVASMGDVEVVGLDLSGTKLTISGH
ncbi:hypothetical protein A11A3_16842 [Alcanivorax hongdengensis A-11-3]|uniref:DUF6160 domain-containing protein n=1 Tax=Alcanivorax hongdengensis A-11-3 TaxID=1177179 RepID=L0W9P5_9GAMM|nr:DUF6160 family protein [Alcanivorax hongdengensis]EKF72812.1 hypothetical protein A11A3_16842 [Alcanivorax hongdengensis A-11-3]